MEAEINIGELNICVGCGEIQVTYSLDEDGLPLCEYCTHPKAEDRAEAEEGTDVFIR